MGKLHRKIETVYIVNNLYNSTKRRANGGKTYAPVVIAEPFNFYTRKQGPDESVSAYLRELKRLAETCELKEILKEVLRCICYKMFFDKTAQCKLISETDLTIEKAFKMVQVMKWHSNDLKKCM